MTTPFRFDTKKVTFTHMVGGPEFDYLIDYEVAVLGAQPEAGLLDLLIRFAPEAHCHFHRHLADTTILVLEGEQHITDIAPDGTETKKVRTAGTYAHSPGGDVHMERGGPDGALVFFGLHGADGRLFEHLDRDGNVVSSSTVTDLAASLLAPG